jgi:hypothetical protein
MVDLLDVFVVSLAGQSKVVLDRSVCVWQAAASNVLDFLLDVFSRVVERTIFIGVRSQDHGHVDLNSLQLCAVVLVLVLGKGLDHVRELVGNVVASFVSLGQGLWLRRWRC